MSALPIEKHNHERCYTYSDYITWEDRPRCELVDGEIRSMASPSQAHQEISGELFRQIANFLRGKPCKVFSAPFDVRLDADKRDNTVFQPDIFVVCDIAKLDGKCCKGAPDWVVEVVSPFSAGYDRLIKFNQYLQAGVREYWIIDPESKTISAYHLNNGQYIANAYGEEDSAPVTVLDGCLIDMREVFINI